MFSITCASCFVYLPVKTLATYNNCSSNPDLSFNPPPGSDLSPTTVLLCSPPFRWMNLAGDLEDLEIALEVPANRPKYAKASWGSRPLGSGHCSALIKVLPDGEDLYTSQVTWSR